MPVDVSSARKLPESGSAGSVPVRLASIDRQLSAVREILDRVEHALGEVVRIDPAKFAGHEALRSAYDGLKRSLAESRARLARPTFRIGTIATTSAGKSTLVNALIGRRLAPLSAQEMSAGLLKLVHAPEGLAVRIEPTDGAVWPTGRWPENPTVAVTDERVYNLIRDDIMTRYNEIKRTQQISMPFVSVETPLLPGCAPDLLGLPAGVGFEIMDLPGLNSTDGDDANLRVIQEQIAGAFCVMVLDYNQTDAKRRHMLLDEMARLVRAMGGRDDTLLFLLNKFNQRDCADSEEEIRKRIDSLQVEIKDRLGLAELPDVVRMDARSWMHAQCAWGATPLRDGPSAPEAVRKQRLREFRHDCTTEIERLFEKHPDIEGWWDTHRKNLQDLPPEELHFLLKSVIMPHTGAGEVLRRLGERLRERCASLIIWPAVHHFIARYEQFVRTVTLLARNGQLETREAIEAAIEATKENVASIRQNLDQEGESFRDQVERIKAGLAAKGSKDSHFAMIEDLHQKYAQLFKTLDSFQRLAREDLLGHLVEPFNEAGSSNEAALRRRLEGGIPQHLAAEVAAAYRSYLDEIASYKEEGDQVVKRVRKSSSGNLSKAKQAIENLTEKLLEAIDRRALYFAQERARDLEKVLIDEVEVLHRKLEEDALARTDDTDAVAAVFRARGARELAQKLKLPANLFALNPDVETEVEQELESTTKKVKKRTWRRLWLWKTEVEEASFEFVDYVIQRIDGPGALVAKVTEACIAALDDLLAALLKWMADAFEEHSRDLNEAIRRLGDVVDAELNRMLAMNVEQLEKEIEKWRMIGERVDGAGPSLAELKTAVLGTA